MGTATARALLVRGGWTGHEPVETSDAILAALRSDGVECTVADSLAVYADRSTMHGLDLVVQCWTMGEIAPEELEGLLAAVRSGVGFAGWHGGLCDAFRSAPAYQFMTGAQWVAHPGGKVDYEVNVVPARRDDPIVAGIDDFSVHTEQYYLHVDPSNDVLATTTFGASDEAPWIAGCVMPVVWTRTYGDGRVFCSALGHDAHDFATWQVGELVRRGCAWAARSRGSGGAP